MRAAARASAALLVLAAAACGGAPRPASYTFNEHNSPVKVDTGPLQALKAASGIQPCPAPGVGTEGTPGGLPDETLPCLGGGHSVSLAGLRGPLVLNFWAQWCGPCRDEAPLLEKFATAARGKVQVMGVDFYDPRPSLAIELARQLGLTYPQLADPEAATKAPLHIAGLPITFLVDSSGRVAYTQVGPITSERELAQLVAQHLGVAGVAS